MNLMIRQILTGVLFSLILAICLFGVTVIVFPPENWQQFYEVTVVGMPFILALAVIIIVAGLIIGLFYGLLWKSKLLILNQSLDGILANQTISQETRAGLGELNGVEARLNQLQERVQKQTELSQKLATERATEREQSLQEVVLQERNRLARELHDSVSQQLFAASMMMSAINESEELDEANPFSQQLSTVEHMIHQSQLEMRALLLHLRPVALKGKSLHEGITELLEELLQKVPMTIQSKIEQLNLDKGIEDQLFRILQESISNTLRHAKASHLNVMLIQRDEWIILRITDDGKGFDVSEEKTSSYGLQNMHERALEIGGTLKIVSLINQGTRLEVKVPQIIKEDKHND